MKIQILFYSKTGHTKEAVEPLAEGILETGAEADVVSIKDFDPSRLNSYDALIAVSPCWGGIVGSTGVASPLLKVLKKLPEGSLTRIKCAGVAVHAKKGGDTTVSHLSRLLANKGCGEFVTGPVVQAGNLAGIGKGPSVGEEDKVLLKEFGRDFAK